MQSIAISKIILTFNTMRQITLFVFLALVWACKKGNKEPECRISEITYSGSTTKLPVTYFGDTVVKVGEDNHGYNLYFDEQKKLIRKEEPVLDPYYRSEIGYNSSGQVIGLRFYNKQGNDWTYEGQLVFTYNNGRVVNIREENAVSQNGNSYDHQFTWQGGDVVSVDHRLNQQIQCTTQFSYDGARPNPMRRFGNFYFVDGDANYVNYKLPYYFSEHLVTKQQSSCPLSETKLFNYTFTASGLVESMSTQVGISTGTTWEYEYECR